MTCSVSGEMHNCKYCSISFKPRELLQKTCGSKQCLQEYKNEWGRKNPKSKEEWLVRNPEKRKQVSTKYRKENSGYYAEYTRLYMAKKMKARPPSSTEWDEFVITEMYDLAKRRNLEIDHIVPLTHKRVCGLHVPENLQMLTRSQNARKSNRFDDEDVLVVWRK